VWPSKAGRKERKKTIFERKRGEGEKRTENFFQKKDKKGGKDKQEIDQPAVLLYIFLGEGGKKRRDRVNHPWEDKGRGIKNHGTAHENWPPREKKKKSRGFPPRGFRRNAERGKQMFDGKEEKDRPIHIY